MNYDRLIIDLLPGATPKEKHDNLVLILDTIDKVCFPSRGQPEEDWTIQDVANLLVEKGLVLPPE